MSNPIIIIGGGIGGLTAAIRLAQAGYRVVIYEQNAQLGGKMGQFEQAGFRWDTGPSVITMRPVFTDLFTQIGRRLEDYLTFQPVEPLTRYFYPDGTQLDTSRDLSLMARQIASLDERDVEGYLAFLAYAARLYRLTSPAFIYSDPPSWRTLTQVSPLSARHIDPFRTMHQAICRYVHTPHLRQLLGRFATYVGASPYQAPATLNVIAHVELTEGVWYPQGGIYAIAQALTRLAEELGVEIHLNCPVQKILTSPDHTVKGVILADGTVRYSHTVIANVDVATVYQSLLLPQTLPPRHLTRHTQLATSCSGFVLLLGLRQTYPQLAHHNIFFSADYPQEFQDIFTRQHPPTDPTIYVAITAKTDPTHAPPHHENWFILVNVPANLTLNWAEYAPRYRDLILARLATFGVEVRPHIVTEHYLTPADLARSTGAYQGALYGLSANNRWTAFRRPHNRSPHVHGLYFVGGSTHPGGGVPMVMLSGKLVANLVKHDQPNR